MILDPEQWMNIRRFRVLRDAGVSISEIARETGHDWKTVKKYLAVDGPGSPPAAPPRKGTQPRLIDSLAPVVESWLRADVTLKGSVIHERLVAEYGFPGSYQRVKMFLAEARPRIAAELGAGDDNPLVGLHRRFEVVPGAQGQVDWGEEGDLFGDGRAVYSFHLVLSYSRDPFCCFTTGMDQATFFDCHRRAFAHFGGVPGALVYDRTKTIVRRHVAPGRAVPLRTEAAAFAAHYRFDIDVLAAYRPTGKGRVERQVAIIRDHVLAGRSLRTVAEADAAFTGWLPIRRAQTHRTHGQIIGERAEADRAALRPVPAAPYLVTERHLRRVGKDCLISFEASLYSVPARRVRAGQRVEVRAGAGVVAVHALAVDGGQLLASHPRSAERGRWMVDKAHWDGLPDGSSRATTLAAGSEPAPPSTDPAGGGGDRLAGLLHRTRADVHVDRRPLRTYQAAAEAGVA